MEVAVQRAATTAGCIEAINCEVPGWRDAICIRGAFTGELCGFIKMVSPLLFHCAAEVLEARIAPASLTFVDVDGDNVTITTNQANTVSMSIQNWQNGSGCSVAPTPLP